MKCFLCQSPLADQPNGYRTVRGSERLSLFSAWYSGSLPADLESINVCYSKCPQFTGFLYHEAQMKLSNDEYRAELDGITIRDAPFSLGYIEYDPALYDTFLSEKRQNVIDRIMRSGIALPSVGIPLTAQA